MSRSVRVRRNTPHWPAVECYPAEAETETFTESLETAVITKLSVPDTLMWSKVYSRSSRLESDVLSLEGVNV